MKDLIIIGAGPAGLSAAIYGIRAGLDLLVLERLSPGGQVVNTGEVENYPGFAEPVAGWDLMARMEEQARRLGVAIESGDVLSLAKNDFGQIDLSLNDGRTLQARTVIAASGASFRKLGVPGEKEHTGRGVSYCATCDGAFFKGKVTAVVGGGNTALEEAHFLTRFAEKVYIIHRRDRFRGERILQERALSCPSVEPVYDSIILSVNGGDKVESVTLSNCTTGEESRLPLDGLFVFVGVDPNTGYLPGEILNDRLEAVVDMRMRTKIPGLFAAGDLRNDSRRQIVTAAADGATAAMEAGDYLASSC